MKRKYKDIFIDSYYKWDSLENIERRKKINFKGPYKTYKTSINSTNYEKLIHSWDFCRTTNYKKKVHQTRYESSPEKCCRIKKKQHSEKQDTVERQLLKLNQYIYTIGRMIIDWNPTRLDLCEEGLESLSELFTQSEKQSKRCLINAFFKQEWLLEAILYKLPLFMIQHDHLTFLLLKVIGNFHIEQKSPKWFSRSLTQTLLNHFLEAPYHQQQFYIWVLGTLCVSRQSNKRMILSHAPFCHYFIDHCINFERLQLLVGNEKSSHLFWLLHLLLNIKDKMPNMFFNLNVEGLFNAFDTFSELEKVDLMKTISLLCQKKECVSFLPSIHRQIWMIMKRNEHSSLFTKFYETLLEAYRQDVMLIELDDDTLSTMCTSLRYHDDQVRRSCLELLKVILKTQSISFDRMSENESIIPLNHAIHHCSKADPNLYNRSLAMQLLTMKESPC